MGATRAEAPKSVPSPGKATVLSSEGDDWADYLSELATKQGKSFETGFVGLDERAEGLTIGLMLLVDQDRDRCRGFLKQLTDQIAARSKVPCLFLSYESPKAALRIRTLSRLSGVPAKDIEKGRLKKDSREWESVEQNGRKAAEWLKRVFIVEADPNMDMGGLGGMVRQLVESGKESTGLLVVDSLERLSRRKDSPQSVLAELKELSDSVEVLVVAATADQSLLTASELDFAAVMSEAQGGSVELELLRAEDSRTTIIRFSHQRNIHKFTEQPGS